MKKYRIWVLTAICVIVLLAGAALADDEKEEVSFQVNQDQPFIYFQKDTVPKKGEYSWVGAGELVDLSLNGEKAITYQCVQESGEKTGVVYIDLVDMSELGEEAAEGETAPFLFVDPDQNAQAGESTFRIHIESEHYWAETVVTLICLPFDASYFDGLPMEVTEYASVNEACNLEGTLDLLTQGRDLPMGFYVDEEQKEAYESQGVLTTEYSAWTFSQPGDYPLGGTYLMADVAVDFSCLIKVADFNVVGNDRINYGESAVYATKGGAQGAELTWRVEGPADSDQQGLVTLTEEAQNGDELVISAQNGEGYVSSKRVKVSRIKQVTIFTPDMKYGEMKMGPFTVPVPEGWEKNIDRYESFDVENLFHFMLSYRVKAVFGHIGSDEEARQFYEAETADWLKTAPGLIYEDVLVDGHPARIYSLHIAQSSADRIYSMLSYVRGNQELTVSVSQYDLDVASYPSQRMKEDTQILLPLTDRISYLKGINEADAALKITAAGNAKTLAAGKSLQLTAAYGNPSAVKGAVEKYDLSWSALDEQGNQSYAAYVDKNGKMGVPKNLSKAEVVVVKVVSQALGTKAEYRVTAHPVIKSVSVSPSKGTVYLGGELTLTAQTKPAGAVNGLLSWSVGKKDQAELTDHGDGTVTIRPKKAGKVTVTVKAAGGKSAKATLTVAVPVEAVEITGPETGKPGATVKLKAAFTPAKPTNNKVEWSVNVEKSVATIDKNGQLKINKKAPQGTVITVTCKALGAPQECIAVKEITVQ